MGGAHAGQGTGDARDLDHGLLGTLAVERSAPVVVKGTANLLCRRAPSTSMADTPVRPLVLGEGSPKSASVPAGAIRGHLLVLAEPQARAAILTDVVTWAAAVGAGVLAIDLDGRLTSLLAERAGKGGLGRTELRVLSPSSTVGIPIAFKPMLSLANLPHTEAWQRIRLWLPPLLATLAGAGAGTPDHDRFVGFFGKLLDDAKARSPSMFTVQTLVASVKTELAGSPDPLTREQADALLSSLTSLAEDLRNAALAYGPPVDLPRLLGTPVNPCEGEAPPHIDVVLLEHMRSVADRNAAITAVLVEAFAWCQTAGREGRLLVVLPEGESPTAFLGARPFAQQLARRVLDSSGGTGLLGVVLPIKLDDPAGLPRCGGVLIERAAMDRFGASADAALSAQGMAPSMWARMKLLNPSEWAFATGKDWAKWFRFTPNPESLRARELDPEELGRLHPPLVRDVFKRRPPTEAECALAKEEEERMAAEEVAAGPAEKGKVAPKVAPKAARAVEDAEDLLSYTGKAPAKRAADARIRDEVKELLRRKLEEKERAKDAQRFEITEIDLVEGDLPPEGAPEVAPATRRPVRGGVIDDHRAGGPGEAAAAGVELHAEDLERELAELKAKEEAEEASRGVKEGTMWVDLSPEEALLGTPPPDEAGAVGGAKGKKEAKPSPDALEGEDIIVDLDGP